MNRRTPFLWLPILAVAAACAPVPANQVAHPSPSPAGSVAPTPAASPSLAPSAPASSAPVASPSAAIAAFSLESGMPLQAYHFNAPGGLAYDRGQNQIDVLDALDTTSNRRYVLRKFAADGSYLSTIGLAPPGGSPPDRVDGVAFDRSGNPFFAYRNQDPLDASNESFQLLTANGGTVSTVGFSPNAEKRASVSAVGSEGDVISVAVIKLDDTRPALTQGQIVYGRADVGDNNNPLALFVLDDPLHPTAHMAFGQNGDLYLAGPTSTGSLALERVKSDKSVQEVPVHFTHIPDGLFVGPDGSIYGFTNSGSDAATVHRYATDGTDLGQTSVRLKAGGYLSNLAGLTIDLAGHVVIAGSGYDAANHPINGLYTF